MKISWQRNGNWNAATEMKEAQDEHHFQEAENKTKFEPDKELVDFAEYFSRNYKKLKPGVYKSKNNAYTIKYEKKLPETKTTFRVGQKSRNIEVDMITPNFVFYMILWCMCILESANRVSLADIKTLDWYKKNTNRGVHDILKGFVYIFKICPINTEMQLLRLYDMRIRIKKHTKKK